MKADHPVIFCVLPSHSVPLRFSARGVGAPLRREFRGDGIRLRCTIKAGSGLVVRPRPPLFMCSREHLDRSRTGTSPCGA